MEHTRNQHYVPQFLLKNFASSKKSFIWTYDKVAKENNWNSIKERPISKVASEDFFYDQIENNKEFTFEYELGKVEREVAPIVEKIVQHKNILIITHIERERLSYFIAIQFIRTKWRLNLIKSQSLDFTEKVAEAFGVVQEELDHKSLWFSLFESASLFSKAIKNKVWFLGESEKLFYSSDNPVVLQNSVNSNELRGTLGLDSYGIEIYLPISDSLLLCCCCEKYLQNKHGILNLEKLPYENILNLNSLQFFQSERFIFSSSNDFKMIDGFIDI